MWHYVSRSLKIFLIQAASSKESIAVLVRGTWEEERILVFSRTCFWMIWCGLPQSLLSPLLCRKRACCRLPIPAGLSRSLQAGRCDTCSHYLGLSVLITANMVILFPNRANCSCCLAAVNLISKHVLHVAALPKQNCKCHNGIVFFFKGEGSFPSGLTASHVLFSTHLKLRLCGGTEEIRKKP